MIANAVRKIRGAENSSRVQYPSWDILCREQCVEGIVLPALNGFQSTIFAVTGCHDQLSCLNSLYLLIAS